jgi:hypothetical protein
MVFLYFAAATLQLDSNVSVIADITVNKGSSEKSFFQASI